MWRSAGGILFPRLPVTWQWGLAPVEKLGWGVGSSLTFEVKGVRRGRVVLLTETRGKGGYVRSESWNSSADGSRHLWA